MGILGFKNKKDEDKADKVQDLELEKPVAKEAKKEAKAEVAAKPAAGEKVADNFTGILLRPVVSEKNSALSSLNQYVFEVSVNANKIQIAKAVKARYGVEPIKVNVANILGKYVRRGRSFGKQKDTRKAIVFLPEGKSIDVYEGI